MKWMNPKEAPFQIYGFPFLKENGRYRRLQIHPPVPLPEGIEHACEVSVGGQIRFRATLRELQISVKLERPLYKALMAPTGTNGFDCYVRRPGIDSDPIYFNVTNVPAEETEYTATLIRMPEPEDFEITMNMPLGNIVTEFSLGFDDDAVIREAAPFEGSRIVVYGGSIEQGSAASRPGMAYTNILSRWLNREFVTLGFSGKGKAEEEVAMAIAEIDNVDMFIIDTAGNCPDAQWLRERLPRFVEVLRERHPTVPILLWQLSDFAKILYSKRRYQDLRERRAVEQWVHDTRRENGDENIYIGQMQFPPEFMGHNIEFEATVDGLHPTDYGFMEYAKKLYPVITEILAK